MWCAMVGVVDWWGCEAGLEGGGIGFGEERGCGFGEVVAWPRPQNRRLPQVRWTFPRNTPARHSHIPLWDAPGVWVEVGFEVDAAFAPADVEEPGAWACCWFGVSSMRAV